MLDRTQTVANVVIEHSECAAVFQKHRIDFCCHGDVSIESAAANKGIDTDALVNDLKNAIAERGGGHASDPRELSTPRLVAHIVSKHHEYLRKALPFILPLSAKVSRVHGDHNPKLKELHPVVEQLADALIPHLDDEEESLFPALIAKSPDPSVVARLLSSMIEEHHLVATLLEKIRAASDEFSVPEWGCNSYRTLMSELRQLESDIFAHVHLENHVLKPRFAQ